ncbi:TPA: hypothetical protein NGR73_001319 [Vibrio parahaemolyticus]|nr:hypothetical protein [Vibrio parahaemolyticus]HCE4544997.1 hypothetical protein [Vibrio parahaemolyticus]
MFSPLSDHRCYLTHIALPNFSDYNMLVDRQRNQERNKIPDQYDRLRLFLNTIESLNNVPEYFFHDVKEAQGWRDCDLGNILGQIRKKHPILRDIEQISNAYKHSVRRDSGLLQAADMTSSFVEITMEEGRIQINFGFDSIADETLMDEAWKFWLDYRQSTDESILLPDVAP